MDNENVTGSREVNVQLLARRLSSEPHGKKYGKKPSATRKSYKSAELPLQRMVIRLDKPELYATVDAVDVEHARCLINAALLEQRADRGGLPVAGCSYDFFVSDPAPAGRRVSANVRRFHLVLSPERLLLPGLPMYKVARREYLRPVAGYRFTDADGKQTLFNPDEPNLPEPGPGERLETLHAVGDDGVCIPAPTDVYVDGTYPPAIARLFENKSYDSRLTNLKAALEDDDEEDDTDDEDDS